MILSWLKTIHAKLIMSRRIDVLATVISELIPDNSTVLDIGCGSGEIANKIQQIRPDINISGIDVYVRDTTSISVKEFDGKQIPFESNSIDYCIFVDVLHHTDNIQQLVSEAFRVCKKGVIIKDHIYHSRTGYQILKFMDWVGNKPHNVVLTYNYQTKKQWLDILDTLQGNIHIISDDIRLYNPPLNVFFSRGLHILIEVSKP
jgi:ubiquinone/menaquinone biosynthesis C-methylase UbiE